MSIVINITNLVGTIVVIGDNTKDLSESVTKALLQVLNQAQESLELDPNKSSKQSEAHSEINQDSQ